MQKLTNEQIVTALSSPAGFASVINNAWVGCPALYAVSDALERVLIGKCKRLIINIPPRLGKTELAVKAFIAWSMGLFPDSQFIHASYSKRLAAKNTYEVRTIMQSGVYKQIFPFVQLKDDAQAKDEFRTTHGGIVYATGTDGTITGYGAGMSRASFGGALVIDDPLNPNELSSDTMRQNNIDWYQSVAKSRLNSMRHTPIIIIMQRLHEADLSGYLLAGGSGEEWEHVCYPAIDEQGNSICEKRMPINYLLDWQASIDGRMTFAGQYMQQPAPAEGGIYKTAWFNERHDFAEPYNGFDLIVHSWDTAYKKEQHNDPSALTVWGVKNNKAYLLHMLRKHMDYPELLAQVNAMCSRFPPDVVLIEDKASGQSLIQELRAKKVLPVIAIKPESDKVTRAVASSGFCEAGLIVLPRNTIWLNDFERELFLFPNAAHDDMVDSTSQFINWWKKQKNTIDYEAIYGY